jgi:hypothetical protein
MSGFDEELWEMLSREHGAGNVRAARPPRLAAHRRRALPLAAGAVALAAATAAAVALLSAGSAPPAAYALTQNSNGTVTLTLDQVLGVKPANEALARLGVRAVVARIEAGCHEIGRPVRPPRAGRIAAAVEPEKTGEGLAGLSWVIHPSAIPAGDTLRLAVQVDPYSRIPALGATMGLFRGKAPSCSRPGMFYPGPTRGRRRMPRGRTHP